LKKDKPDVMMMSVMKASSRKGQDLDSFPASIALEKASILARMSTISKGASNYDDDIWKYYRCE
jgi:hypothetical protein